MANKKKTSISKPVKAEKPASEAKIPKGDFIAELKKALFDHSPDHFRTDESFDMWLQGPLGKIILKAYKAAHK